MFNLGMGEILVLGVIALIVVGPEKLPGLARNVGRFINDLKRTTSDVTREISRSIDEQNFNQDPLNKPSQNVASVDTEKLKTNEPAPEEENAAGPDFSDTNNEDEDESYNDHEPYEDNEFES